VNEMEVRHDLAGLSDRLAGLVVAGIGQPDPNSIELRFTNGAALVIAPHGDALAAVLRKPKPRGSRSGTVSEPTPRQREYLEFIGRFQRRLGVAPAETDIQRHFLISAPSVNQMIRTLERRGFIERDRDWFGRTVPRSIRVLWDG
jgi:hypothetical protein